MSVSAGAQQFTTPTPTLATSPGGRRWKASGSAHKRPSLASQRVDRSQAEPPPGDTALPGGSLGSSMLTLLVSGLRQGGILEPGQTPWVGDPKHAMSPQADLGKWIDSPTPAIPLEES